MSLMLISLHTEFRMNELHVFYLHFSFIFISPYISLHPENTNKCSSTKEEVKLVGQQIYNYTCTVLLTQQSEL
jgi:hypothetical protein